MTDCLGPVIHVRHVLRSCSRAPSLIASRSPVHYSTAQPTISPQLDTEHLHTVDGTCSTRNPDELEVPLDDVKEMEELGELLIDVGIDPGTEEGMVELARRLQLPHASDQSDAGSEHCTVDQHDSYDSDSTSHA